MNVSLPFASLSHITVNEWTYDHWWTCNWSAAPRPHNALCLVTDGYCEIEDLGHTFRVMPGEMFFVPVGARYLSHWHPGCRNITIMCSFFPNTQFPGDRMFEIQKLSPQYDGEFQKLYERALRNVGADGNYSFAVLSCLFEIMHKILPRLVFSKRVKRDERIERVVTYLDSHYHENTTVAELAAVAQMSIPHFHAIFKETMGVTPIEYRNRVRISHAVTYLIRGGKTIEAISEELGFESVTYFRKVFKKHIGCPPSKFVKNNTEI